ncbi:hypothetical protein [Bacillus pseudomycoides]|uniref:hypothetical protein n=1 Tax=Bacillus pseudomycoides TaxID=64104 RepID=UPI0015CF1084|nr:hypothetical protein [Bacillus pseudomycoides]
MERRNKRNDASIYKGEILHSQLNNSKAIEVLKWKPASDVSFGLNQTISYLKKANQSKS